MGVKGWAITMGIGAAAGAVAILMMPRNNPARKLAAKAADKVDAFLSVEMSMGQMVEDVRLAVNGKKPVEFFGRTGGVIPTPDEIYDYVMKMKGGVSRD